MRNILYLGWVGYANIGDDLMLDVFRKYAKEKYGEEVKVKGLYPKENMDNFEDYDLVVLGGGSNLLEGYIDVVYNAMKKGKKIMIWGSGYDELLERNFIDKIEKTNIPPYLYSDSHEQKLNEIASYAEFFGVRGPLTYKLLEKSFVDMTNVIISGDPGFLLEPEDLDEKGTSLDFNENSNTIAINIGGTFNRIYGGNEEKILDEVRKLCFTLLQKGYKLYLYPMWDMDVEMLVKLYKSLPMKKNITLDVAMHTGGQLLSILKKCKYSIGFKLHSNIISALANTPFICFEYRLKCYDFLKSIDCEKLGIPTDSSNLQEDLESTFNYIVENEEEIKHNLKIKVDDYITKLKKSLEII